MGSTRRRLLIPVTVTSVAAIAVGALSTAALFTDTASVPNNAFAAGTVDLNTTPTSIAFKASSMAPGDTVTTPVEVRNDGTLAYRYAMSSTATGALASALTLSVKTDVAQCTNTGFAASGTVLYGPGNINGITGTGNSTHTVLGDPAQGPNVGDRVLDPGQAETLCVQVGLPGADTTNQYQNQNASVEFRFDAEQTAHNPDGPAIIPASEVAATASTQGIRLTWTPSSDPAVTGYQILRAKSDDLSQGSSTTTQAVATMAPATKTMVAAARTSTTMRAMATTATLTPAADAAPAAVGTYQRVATLNGQAVAAYTDTTAVSPVHYTYDVVAVTTDGRTASAAGDHPTAFIPLDSSDSTNNATNNDCLNCSNTSGNVIAWWGTTGEVQPLPDEVAHGTAISVSGSNDKTTGAMAAVLSSGKVVEWHEGSTVALPVPAAVTSGVKAICSASNNSNIALKTDGSVVTWETGSSIAQALPSTVKSIKEIGCSGSEHYTALTTAGTVIAWLGGTTTPTALPTAAKSGIAHIGAAGIAITTTGKAITWNNNTTTTLTVPSAATSGVLQVAGWWASGQPMALKTGGTVAAWTGASGASINVPAFARADVARIFGYANYGAAIKTDGSVVVWGSGSDTASSPVPPEASHGVAALSVASGDVIAIRP